MTDERRQDLLLVALVVSVVAHIALMFFIKPQVMMHVAATANRSRPRPPMTVTDAPTKVEPVSMAEVRDVAPEKDSPTAADDQAPLVSSFDAPKTEAISNAPEAEPPALEEAPQPKMEIASHLSEKIYIEKPNASWTTPIVSENLRMSAPQTVATAPSAVEATKELPMFTAPTFTPAVPEKTVAQLPAVLPVEEEADEPSETFVPEEEIRATVDERVVEAEKAAVRDLLDVKDARELNKFVSFVTTSATAGDWTYFRVQMNPRTSLPVVPKDVVVLLDASGSIGSDRLKSCRNAARTILRSCTNTGDRFNLVAFRDRFTYAFRSWQTCSQVGFERADKWLNSLAAHGRTDVFSVIRSVLTLPRDPKRPLIALVVTDGDANSGVSETAEILSKFTALNDGLISVYMYGVKGSANRELIDVLTRGNRGESYIYGGYRWKAGSCIEGLSDQFRDPVLSDLRLVFATDSKAEVYPRRLRNIYRAGLVDFVGRVPKGVTEVAFSLKGLNGAQSYEGFFKLDLTTAAFDGQIPDRWKAELTIDEKLR